MPHDAKHPSPFRRGGPAGLFSFEVRGPCDAVVTMAVEHRDEGSAMWSAAGSLSVLAPAESVLRVSGLKEELRFRFAVVGAGDRPAEVRLLPPEWLPC